MPHLSPMKWFITFLTMWLALLSYSSLNWWHQHPVWPKKNTILPKSTNTKWNWY